MRTLTVFNFLTLNGFFKGPNDDISWHQHGGEESKYSEAMLQQENTLLFGRVTYEMMAAFWPSPMAAQSSPIVAEGMNKAEKIVFSKTLKKASWNNTRIISENIVEEIKKLKQSPGKNLALLGSGEILTQLAEAGLIDEYQFMIDPVAIGKGTPVFHNIKTELSLKHKETRTFKSGIVLLTYEKAS